MNATRQSPLGQAMSARLVDAFPDVTRGEPAEARTLAVFRSANASIGEIVLMDDGEELTAYVGQFTHLHFDGGGIDDDETPAAHEGRVVDEVMGWSAEVFADRIEFFGSHERGGGCRPRTGAARGRLSRWFFGARTWVWSGPVDPPGD